jgi:hypothetical protein
VSETHRHLLRDRGYAARVRLRSLVIVALALLAGTHLAACGGSSERETVASVGAVAISQAQLSHWAAISKHASHRSAAAARAHALNYLLVSAWIRGEARRRGVAVSAGAVENNLNVQSGTTVGGRQAFEAALSASRETRADAKSRIETELLYRGIERQVTARAQVSRAAMVAYYRRHRRRFLIPERRFFLSDSQTDIHRIARDHARILAGGPFPKQTLHEALSKNEINDGGSRRRKIHRAIFAAPVGKLIGPFHNEPIEFYTLVEVTRILPARYETFMRAKGQIEHELKVAAEQKALQGFRDTWQMRWGMLTHCRQSEAAPACARSPETAGSPLALTL